MLRTWLMPRHGEGKVTVLFRAPRPLPNVMAVDRRWRRIQVGTWGKQFSANIWPCRVLWTVDCQVQYTKLRWTVASCWHLSPVSGCVCFWRETNTKCFWQEARTAFNCSGKSETEVIKIKDCAVEANYWQSRSIARPLCDSRATCYPLQSRLKPLQGA